MAQLLCNLSVIEWPRNSMSGLEDYVHLAEKKKTRPRYGATRTQKRELIVETGLRVQSQGSRALERWGGLEHRFLDVSGRASQSRQLRSIQLYQEMGPRAEPEEGPRSQNCGILGPSRNSGLFKCWQELQP